MATLPPAAWLKTFETAARTGGFTAAGEELGLTPAAVSQQIRALEGRLGFTLFRRLPRGVALTDMGRAYLPSVQRAFDELSLATAGLFGVGRADTLTVRAPLSYTALILAPRLPAFRAANPDVPVRLCTSIWTDDLEPDACDVDIRFGDGRWPAAERTQISAPLSVPVSPPGSTLDLSRAIHIMGCESFWDAFARAHHLDHTAIGHDLSADSSLVALEMVAAGLGSAIIARDLARPFAAAGRVSIPDAMTLNTGQAHWLILPEDRRARAEALLLRAWLLEDNDQPHPRSAPL